jgi:hypothetical protein
MLHGHLRRIIQSKATTIYGTLRRYWLRLMEQLESSAVASSPYRNSPRVALGRGRREYDTCLLKAKVVEVAARAQMQVCLVREVEAGKGVTVRSLLM